MVWLILYIVAVVIVGYVVYWPVYHFRSPFRHLLTYPPLPATVTLIEWARHPGDGWNWFVFGVWFIVLMVYYAAFVAVPANERVAKEEGRHYVGDWRED